MDYSLPGFSVYGVFQARILERVTISYSRGSSLPRDQTCISCVSCMSRQIHYNCHLRSAHTTPDLTKKTEDEPRVSISSFTNSAKSMSVTKKMHISWISSVNNCRTDSCSSWKSSLWLAGLMFHSFKKERAMPRVHLAGMRNVEAGVSS